MTTPQPPEQSTPAPVPPPPAQDAAGVTPAPDNPGPRPDGTLSWPADQPVPGRAEAAAPVTGPPSPGGGSRRLLIAGGAGAVAGALIVGILWAASSFVGSSGNDAADDAAAACGVFARVPDSWQPETVSELTTYQIGGAISLAQAAGQGDNEYRVLAAQAQQLQQAYVTFDVGRVAQLITDVRNTCDDL